jgi:hypothetical protein
MIQAVFLFRFNDAGIRTLSTRTGNTCGGTLEESPCDPSILLDTGHTFFRKQADVIWTHLGHLRPASIDAGHAARENQK